LWDQALLVHTRGLRACLGAACSPTTRAMASSPHLLARPGENHRPIDQLLVQRVDSFRVELIFRSLGNCRSVPQCL